MSNLNVLSEQDRAVLETIRMRLSRQESLLYLKDHGFEMSQTTLTRHKRKLESQKLKRLYNIAKYGFQDAHLERIEQLELIQRLMWQDYKECKDAFKRACILEKIASIQPYLSAYYEATKDIIALKKRKKKLENEHTEEDIDIPQS